MISANKMETPGLEPGTPRNQVLNFRDFSQHNFLTYDEINFLENLPSQIHFNSQFSNKQINNYFQKFLKSYNLDKKLQIEDLQFLFTNQNYTKHLQDKGLNYLDLWNSHISNLQLENVLKIKNEYKYFLTSLDYITKQLSHFFFYFNTEIKNIKNRHKRLEKCNVYQVFSILSRKRSNTPKRLIEFYPDFKKKFNEFNIYKNNLKYISSYLDLFFHYNLSHHFISAKNLLQVVSNSYLPLTSTSSNFTKSVKYYSNNQFCYYTNFIKSYKLRKQISGSLDFYEKNHNLTYSFLTISPKNIKDITKKDLLDLSQVITKFFKDKVIKEVFKGYFGVLEIKEKENDYYNSHFHFLTLRSKSFEKGFIKQSFLKNKFKYYCDKSSNPKINGSFMIDIKKVKSIDSNHGASKYILSYLTKGIDIKTLEARKKIINASYGVRFIRSGGLLLQRYQKDIATYNDIENKLILSLKTGKQYIENVDVKTHSFDLENELSNFFHIGDSTEKDIYHLFYGKRKQMPNILNFNNKKLYKKEIYFDYQKNFFQNTKFICPFTHTKLEFTKISKSIKTKDNPFEDYTQLKVLEFIEKKQDANFTKTIDNLFQRTFTTSREVFLNLEILNDNFIFDLQNTYQNLTIQNQILGGNI